MGAEGEADVPTYSTREPDPEQQKSRAALESEDLDQRCRARTSQSTERWASKFGTVVGEHLPAFNPLDDFNRKGHERA